jgi:predicted nucleotidyltransferase
MRLLELLQQRRNEILNIAARYGASNVRIFGSVARGEDRADSDIDFLVDLEPHRTLFDLGGLYSDLHDLLGHRVDVVTENGISKYIRPQVLAEAVPL